MGLKNTGNSSWRSPPAVAATSNSNTGSDSTAKSKPTVVKKGHTTSKTIIKFHSKSCVDTAQQETAFHKFDVTVPQQAHKMQQRQKAVAKGKNTVGYDEYIRQVPKQKRKKFSMETPATPDASLDIPNKKWNGMVKAWCVFE
jgi:Histone RNA hairpin-binding protein RNA-binding domain